MEIEINFNESKEITISEPKKVKHRPGDDYDYNDPLFEPLPEEEKYVRIEPRLSDFMIINPNQPTQKAPINTLETICAMQNAIFHKIISHAYSEEELFSFFVYDLMVNHDLTFKRMKETLISKINEENVNSIMKCANNEFILSKYELLKEELNDIINRIKVIGEKEETYSENKLILNDELGKLIFYFIDLNAQMRCIDNEIMKHKPFKYNSFRKSVYFEVLLFFRSGVPNFKSVGASAARISKKLLLGKNNGYSLEYLCLEKQ